MDQNSLGNYRSDISNLSDEPEEKKAALEDSQAAIYHQEINTLKIEKLSQRITIISVILPIIIIAVLAFAYIDMKERVVDADETQESHVEQIARTLEEKLNALDVRIAKATFDLDEKLALIEKKSQDLENQAAKMSSSKADLKSVEAALASLEKGIKANRGQDKAALAAVEQIKKSLQADIKKSNANFKSASAKIKEEIQLFKEEFDARLLELSAYEQEIAGLIKTTGLLDKRVKTLKLDIETSLARQWDKTLDSRLAAQKQALETAIQKIEDKLKDRGNPIALPPKPAPKPDQSLSKPPSGPMDIPEPVSPPVSGSDILEQNLTQ